MKPEVKLDKWVVTFFVNTARLGGIVSGHSRLPDGDEIFTSPVEKWTENKDAAGRISIQVETRNTIYNLGEFGTELRERLEREGMTVGNTLVNPSAN